MLESFETIEVFSAILLKCGIKDTWHCVLVNCLLELNYFKQSLHFHKFFIRFCISTSANGSVYVRFFKRQVGKGFCKVNYILCTASCLKIRALSPRHFLTMFVIRYNFIPLCAGKHSSLYHGWVLSLWKS